MDRIALSLAVAPIVFAVCALATRAPRRRIGAALAGGVAFACGNAAVDGLATTAGWWSYPGATARAVGPPHWYAAAGLAAAGVSLIGWRVERRFGRSGTLAFLVAFAGYCVLRDWRVARATGAIVFAEGAVPLAADGSAAFALMALALAVQRAFSREAR